MQIPVLVQTREGGEWLEGVLTDERNESSHGLPVVMVEGEELARATAEVWQIDVSAVVRILLRAGDAGFRLKRK